MTQACFISERARGPSPTQPPSLLSPPRLRVTHPHPSEVGGRHPEPVWHPQSMGLSLPDPWGEVGEPSYSRGIFLNPWDPPQPPFPSALHKLSTPSLPGTEPSALLLRAEFCTARWVFSWASGDTCGVLLPQEVSLSSRSGSNGGQAAGIQDSQGGMMASHAPSCVFSPEQPCGSSPEREEPPCSSRVDRAQNGH